MIGRLQAPINAAASLTTENVNVHMAGDDVLIEQLSTIVNSEGQARHHDLSHLLRG